MSQSSGRDGFTSHTRPTGSAPTSLNALRHPQQHSHPAPNALTNQLIPRDYLSSLSSSRANGARATPTPPPIVAVTPPPSEPSKSLGLVDRSVLREDSDESEADEADVTPPTQPPASSLHVVRTRQPPSTNTQPEAFKRSNPSPESPISVASSAATHPSIPNDMPRTSSIDSAISTISNSSWPQKSANETREPSVGEIRNLIATAGSAENLVQHLLRDKAQAASQNAQLWKLVDKQRALLLGLNKDLERLTKERDRYRKKAKDLQATQVSDRALHSHTPPTSARHQPESTSLNGGNVPQAASGWTEPPRQNADDMEKSPSAHEIMHSSLPLQQQPEMIQKQSDYSAIPATMEAATPQSQKAQQPKLPSLATTQLSAPVFNLTEATPLGDTPARSFANSRKNAPRSLDLKHPGQQQQSSNDDVLEDSDVALESFDRGRRKTREEDDREREMAVLQEQEARSRSLKEKRSKEKLKSQQEHPPPPTSPPAGALPPQPPSTRGHLDAPLPGGLAAIQPQTLDARSNLSPPLRSPGLPSSPRPMDRPLGSPLPAHMTEQPSLNSLPMSPRNGGFPLSPRAPKQPLPANINPGTIPAQKQSDPASEPRRELERPHVDTAMSSTDIPPVYRGLISPTYPDLLLPPNAIPSIQIKVVSSRLKPSRFSVLGLRPQEDTSVFSLSVFSRSSYNELWRLEKIPSALPHLDQQLRQRVPNLPKLPDRKLFNGHAPATVDARRNAIEAYFEELLDTQVDEQAALLICKFLSTDVVEPPADSLGKKNQTPNTPKALQVDAQGRLLKSGLLTKKGKNFGGWKARYFVLDSPELRYFESQGGAHLGTIKLTGARIGRQTSDAASEQGEEEGQFRHAFLILEPKRKDSNSYVRHVLCAENDTERDEWVQALLHYVDEQGQDARPTTSGAASDVSGSVGNPRQLLRGTDYADGMAESSAKASSPIPGQSGSASPTSSTSANAEMEAQKNANYPPHFNAAIAQRQAKQQTTAGPSQREQKIRNLFQFKHKTSQEQLNAQHQKQHKDHAHIRPVFGLPLAEAVEICPPDDVDVLLPAVVYRCIEYLRGKKALNEEGLFRLSGSNVVIKTLKERFNTEGDVDLLGEGQYYDVHAVAGLFKTYLRELPSTLLTRDLHLEFLRVLELDDRENKITTFNALVHRLPDVNYALLRAMSEYLLEIVQNSDRNKMTVKNIGIVFSPTLNIPAPVFSMFLMEFDEIFNRRHDESLQQQALLTAPRGSNDSDDRSSQHQMVSDLPATTHNATSFQQNQQHSHHQINHQVHHGNPAASYHGRDPAAEFGPSPVQQQPSSYESRQYVSIPHQQGAQQAVPPQPMYPAPEVDQPRQMQYRMTVPDGANEKAKRRESALFFG